MRFLTALVAGLLVAWAPAGASPQAQAGGETVLIPFEPPVDTTLRYRWEQSELKDGKLQTSWSVDDYQFEEATDGYRLVVTPVSSGSNETNPAKLELQKKLEELTDLPFVLRLNKDADIVELERAEEYWSKIIAALRDGLARLEPKRPGHDKMVDAVMGMFTDMSDETRLAKLTEPIQPLVDFAWTETSIGKPLLTSVKSTSPLGPVQQHVAITLQRVSDGFAYLTIRSSIPSSEMKKLTAALFDRLNNGALEPEDVAKARAQLAAAENFKAETVADYKIAIEDGMLESFHSTHTVTAISKGKPESRTKTMSVKRTD